MLFAEKITGLASSDRVLEVGPGMSPHPRADVFLEMLHEDESEFARQTGGAKGTKPTRDVVFYDGTRFPFADHAFDYVICSHVIEHVKDIPAFVSELVRVGKAGYLEYPTILYEYLYNFDVHVNFVKMRDGVLLYLPKSETPLATFLPVQKVLYRSLELGYTQLVDSLLEYMIEGFEWRGSISCQRASSLNHLTGDLRDLQPNPVPRPNPSRGLITRAASAIGMRLGNLFTVRNSKPSAPERLRR